jgi:hypothetical protein
MSFAVDNRQTRRVRDPLYGYIVVQETLMKAWTVLSCNSFFCTQCNHQLT